MLNDKKVLRLINKLTFDFVTLNTYNITNTKWEVQVLNETVASIMIEYCGNDTNATIGL